MRNGHSKWQEANQQYLSGMIRLLKKRLINDAGLNTEQEKNDAAPGQDENELRILAEAMTSPPAVEKLAMTLGLSSFEKNILLICAGLELDPELNEMIGSSQSQLQPTFGLAFTLFPEAHWSAISPGSPLRYWRLIEISRSQLITRSSIKIDEHILHYLTGVSTLNEKLEEITERIDPSGELVLSQKEVADDILQALTNKASQGALPVLHIYGSDRTDKLNIAAYVSSRIQSTLYFVSAYSLPANHRDVIEFARLWNREAALNDYVLFLDCSNLDTHDKPRLQSIVSLMENISGLVILDSDQWTPELKRSTVVFDIKKPKPAEQLQLWETIIGKDSDTLHTGLEKIVSQFNLGAGTIRKAGVEFISQLSSNGKNENGKSNHLEKKIWNICCRYTRPQVDELAQRIDPVATWDDIVLPEMQKYVLKEMAAQVKQRNKVYSEWGFESKGNRGLGISALFAGESGTGKTMAAEVLANELDLDIYKIDLSKVVNKYIGETEKNLKKIFDAAEDGGAILLFDEADALFGKRSDVKDSHDRYSNIEVSYLLQRMDAYRGLAILTTNMKNAVDKAFTRRIRFIVHFPFPDAIQRAEIWSKVFPGKTPKETLDLEKLSRLSIPGGSIRNIALNAAFIAADENKPVQMSHIYRAVKSEYDKIEKPYTLELRGR